MKKFRKSQFFNFCKFIFRFFSKKQKISNLSRNKSQNYVIADMKTALYGGKKVKTQKGAQRNPKRKLLDFEKFVGSKWAPLDILKNVQKTFVTFALLNQSSNPILALELWFFKLQVKKYSQYVIRVGKFWSLLVILFLDTYRILTKMAALVILALFWLILANNFQFRATVRPKITTRPFCYTRNPFFVFLEQKWA